MMRRLVLATGLMVLLPFSAGSALAQGAPAAPAAGAASGLGLPSFDTLQATRDRPLFAPSRRPPPPEAAPEPDAEPEEAPVAAKEWEYELNGIVIGPGVNVAVLKHRESNETRRLGPGEEIEAWKVDEISPRALVLKKGTKTMRMELFAAAASQAKVTAKDEDSDAEDASSDSNSEMSNDSDSSSSSDEDSEDDSEGSAKPYRPPPRTLPLAVPPMPQRLPMNVPQRVKLMQRPPVAQRPAVLQRLPARPVPLPARQR